VPLTGSAKVSYESVSIYNTEYYPDGKVKSRKFTGEYARKIDGSVTVHPLGSVRPLLPSAPTAMRNTSVRLEVTAELPTHVAESTVTEMSFTVFNRESGQDLWLARANGVLINFYVARGFDTLAQVLFPARRGFQWLGAVSEEISLQEVYTSVDLDTLAFQLRFAQLDRQSPLMRTTRAAIVGRDEVSGSDLGAGVTDIIVFPGLAEIDLNHPSNF
jgi:hypothetical protein